MKIYREVTPVEQRLDNSLDFDDQRSSYTNIRFGVIPVQIIVIDSKYQANLPGLAYDFYGDQEYWRAILAFNGLIDPINDITTGRHLGLPDASSLQAFMTAKNSYLVESLRV